MQYFSAGRQLRSIKAAFCLLAALVVSLPATEAAASGRRASMVIDANTGKVLHASNADELRHPASLTKVMTLSIVFEELESGRLTLQSRIRMSDRAASAPPSKLSLRAGEEISVRDAILALTTKSANDIAAAVAEHIGGSEPEFARRMTEKARLLGMSKTTFRNASGLPNIEQVTTARDMLTLALHIQDDYPQYYRFFSVQSFTFKGRTYRNHNALLRTFPGMDGLKTGYIRMSGFNLVSSAKRGERRVVAAVFGGATAGARNAEMRTLLNRTLPRASTTKTRKPLTLASSRVSRPVPATRTAAKAAPAPAPAPSAAAAAVQPVPAPALPPAPAPIPVAETPAPVSEPAITIAKVRPVMVAPVAQQPQSPLTSAPVPESDQGHPQLIGTGTPAQTVGFRPSTLQQQAENLAQGRPPVTVASLGGDAVWAASTPLRPIAAVETQPARPRAEPIAAVATLPAKPAASGGYIIQVGAYGSAGEAEKALASALERAAGVLSEAAPVTTPVRSGSRQLFRARFAGFDSQAAQTACQELRRRQIDCFVARGE